MMAALTKGVPSVLGAEGTRDVAWPTVRTTPDYLKGITRFRHSSLTERTKPSAEALAGSTRCTTGCRSSSTRAESIFRFSKAELHRRSQREQPRRDRVAENDTFARSRDGATDTLDLAEVQQI